MRILLLGPECDRPHGEGSSGFHNIRAPLIALGHEILDVDFRAELKRAGRDELARKVKALVEREQPDLLFHMVSEDELLPDVARYIARETATLSVAFFSDDDWRLDHSLGVIPHYNFGLTTAHQAVPLFRQAGFTNVILTQYAANPGLYHPIEAVTKTYDVTFVGQAYRGRPELVQWLKEHGVNINVWGQGWERTPALRDCAGGFLPHAELLRVLAASKIVLGMSWTADAKALQIKGRIFEYAAAGAFQLSTYDERLAEYFDIGREIALYRTQDDLLDKIQYYLAHDEEREGIARAGYARVLKDHTWAQRFQQMCDTINRSLPPGKRPLKNPASEGVPRRTQRPASTPSPRVTVLCTVYNGEQYLDDTIRSVLGQEFMDWELVLFDDGSTDGTREIVMRHIKDPRIRYIHHANIAQGGAAFDRLLNTCMEYVRGEYVAFIGADDLFMPEKLAVQMEALAADPAIDIVFSDGTHIDAGGRLLGTDFRFPESLRFTQRSLLRTLFRKNIVAHPTALIRTAAIERLGGFETGFCPDYQLWLKAARYLKFAYVDKKLVHYRIHDRGISTGRTSKTLPESTKLLSLMRERVTIRDLYPELDGCRHTSAALYSAYVHFGLSLATANIPVPQLAVAEYRRALEHCEDGIEAVNNLGVLLALLGHHEKAERYLQFRHHRWGRPPVLEHNLAVLRQLTNGAKTLREGFILLSQDPKESELLRLLDPPVEVTRNAHYYSDLIAAVRPLTPEPAAGMGCTPAERAPMREGVTPTDSSFPESRTCPSTGSRPMVSVIMPTHNRPEQLKEAVASVLRQTYENYEIIVVNDAGCPVESVLATFQVPEKIVYVKHAVNRGLASARNTGLRIARGKYIAYLDDDDRFLPDHLETLVAVLESGGYRVAYSDAWRVHEEYRDGRYVETGRDVPYSHEFSAKQLLISNYFPVLSVMHERSCLDEAGLFDESLTSHEDWDLWIRLSLRYQFAHLKKVTAEFTWRTDGSSMTSRIRPDFVRTAELIYAKYRKESEAMPGVRALQAQALRELRAVTGSQERTFDCSIIIPVWNKVELTQQCLTALAEVTEGVEYEVIVVDNGSTDGTPRFLSQLSGDIQVIRNPDNLGFAKACNQGAKAARGKFLVFLNNDTIPLKGWLSALVDEVRSHPEVAVVGGKLLYEDGTIQHAGVAFSRDWFTPYHIYRGFSAQSPAVSRRREFQCVTAACMLVRREVFFGAGGFDEGFKNGFEDVDLCLKIGQQQWKIVYQPASVLYHLESRTPGRKTHEAENGRRLRERWAQCWWLPDEDWIHLEDGFAFHSTITDGKLGYRLEIIDDPKTKAERSLVADLQRAAHRHDREAVIACLTRSAEWPADIWILRWAALVCLAVSQPELAVPFWQRVLALEEDDQARLALAKLAVARGALNEADVHLSALLSHHPDYGEGWLLRGVMAMQHEAYGEAGEAFRRAGKHGADRRKVSLGMIMAAAGEGKYDRAWAMALPLCEGLPDDEECFHWLLRCGTALERWEDLEVRLKSFVARNPGNLAMRFARAGVLLRTGHREEARLEYERLRVLAPSFEGLDELAEKLGEAEVQVPSPVQTVTGHAA